MLWETRPLPPCSIPWTMPLKPTLALADDDTDHSALVAARLGRMGYEVVLFASGDDLVSWAERTRGCVDAFVLDVDMPGRDGFQSCRDLKSIADYSATPAVFVTSKAGEGIEAEVLSSGGSRMIAKDGEMLPRLTAWLEEALGTAV